MIRQPLAMALLILMLGACSDDSNDVGVNRDKRKFSLNVSPKETHKDINKAGKKEQHFSDLPISSVLDDPSLAPNTESTEDVEQYRQDYYNAVDMENKVEALGALVQADEKNAVAVLQEAYDSPEPELRREAVLQMGDFTDNEQVIDLLLKALDDTDAGVVMEAIEGLSELDNQGAIDGLSKIAQSHPDESVRGAAQEYVDLAKGFDQ